MVGQQTLEVVLGQRHRDADEHAHAADEHEQELHRAEAHALEQEVGDADDAVDTGLRENAGDQHRDRGGGGAVGVGRQRVEGHDEGLGGEADVEEGEGQLGGVVHRPGDEGRKLREVEGVVLGVEHDDAGEDRRRAHAADDQVLERRLERAVDLGAEGRQRDRREGQDLHHDEHVEDIAREDQAQHAAREHAVQGVVLGHAVVMDHVADGVEAGDEDRGRDQQAEEEAQRVDLERDADGVAAGDGAVAHPVGDDLAAEHDGLDQADQEEQAQRRGQQRDPGARAGGVFEVLRGLGAAGRHHEGAEEQHHDRIDREVMVIHQIHQVHPLSLLISRVSSVP